MYPLKLIPSYKDYIWGGIKLKVDFGKKSDLEKLAESWELSCHKDGESTIAKGEFAGMTLSKYIEKYHMAVLGTNCERFNGLPILIKLIDAKDNLSVQVHPDNDYALRVEGEYGKTEMWYILDCEENAALVYGFTKSITKDEFNERIQNNTLMEVLNKVKVQKGDVLFIEPGTLHAIGKGIVIAEIQQNSNITYRIYDYGRVGADGKLRELHVDKALEVTQLAPPKRGIKPQGKTQECRGYSKTLLTQCKYFTVNALKVVSSVNLIADKTSFNSILCTEGNSKLRYNGEAISLTKGESIFIPAGMGEYTIEGSCEILLTTV